jgi:tetraacyldisaccharide 4'-kinase
MGGTGKTPFVEYLIRLLKDDFSVATLSRGYKRKSRGFYLGDSKSSVDQLGDESFQFYTKFNDIRVAVDEKRVRGIKKLKAQVESLDVVLLDDAFQHRWVKPGLSILLTDFYHLYRNDFVFPAGKLREFRSGAKRADIIVVTKAPKVLSPFTRRRIEETLKPAQKQSLYFSFIRHGALAQIPGAEYIPDRDCHFSSILLVAGIANPYPLELYLKGLCTTLETMYFPDHHQYSNDDVDQIRKAYHDIFAQSKIIVTTEKDMMRLIHPDIFERIRYLPICYIPIRMKIHKEDRDQFEKQIYAYVRGH